jgi:drug/metabolite transporter (DMT)-like permease
MLGIGALFFGAAHHRAPDRRRGAVDLGVLVVLSRGDWDRLLQVRLVPGDLYMLLGTIAWAVYSWLLARPHDPQAIRSDWAAFLMAQTGVRAGWSGAVRGRRMGCRAAAHRPGLGRWLAALAFVASARRSWPTAAGALGVQRAGPTIASFFSNLTPLFAAVMSAAFLGEAPHGYHGIAFLLIVGGIVVSSRKA